jgi:hypothetical protein
MTQSLQLCGRRELAMFTTLNLRWLIHLQERDARTADKITNNPQPQRWRETLVYWCKWLSFDA